MTQNIYIKIITLVIAFIIYSLSSSVVSAQVVEGIVQVDLLPEIPIIPTPSVLPEIVPSVTPVPVVESTSPPHESTQPLIEPIIQLDQAPIGGVVPVSQFVPEAIRQEVREAGNQLVPLTASDESANLSFSDSKLEEVVPAAASNNKTTLGELISAPLGIFARKSGQEFYAKEISVGETRSLMLIAAILLTSGFLILIRKEIGVLMNKVRPFEVKRLEFGV